MEDVEVRGPRKLQCYAACMSKYWYHTIQPYIKHMNQSVDGAITLSTCCIYRFVDLPFSLSIYLTNLIYLTNPIYLSIYPSIYVSIYPSICLPICLSMHLSVHTSIHTY